MYGALDISTSGMIAQRTRLEVVSANLAGQNTLYDAAGKLNPYRRRVAMFAPGAPDATNPMARAMGVHVQAIELDASPARPGKYDPENPDAYPSGPYKGYVATTNVDPITEEINALDARRAYEANVSAAETTKAMFTQALRLIA